MSWEVPLAPDPKTAQGPLSPQMVVTIDGPAGAGKSTLARSLAQALGWTYLDSGALYRALALAALRQGLKPDEAAGLAALAEEVDIRLVQDQDGIRVFLGREEVTAAIRTEAVSRAASDMSKLAPVRERLTGLQRRLARAGRVVLEGRDAGTVVFPEAAIKFFLTADLDVRAARRAAQLSESGPAPEREKIRSDMACRDAQDASRSLAPLKVAPGAVVVDTTRLTPEEVLARLMSEVRRAFPG